MRDWWGGGEGHEGDGERHENGGERDERLWLGTVEVILMDEGIVGRGVAASGKSDRNSRREDGSEGSSGRP